MHQSIAVVVYTQDPENKIRFLLRHNKPFDGYKDEWGFVFGSVEEDESLKETAARETEEELGISKYLDLSDMDYSITFEGKHGKTEAHFFAMKLNSINTQVVLNGESIGYDWVLPEVARKLIPYEDEREVITKILDIEKMVETC